MISIQKACRGRSLVPLISANIRSLGCHGAKPNKIITNLVLRREEGFSVGFLFTLRHLCKPGISRPNKYGRGSRDASY